MPVYIDLRLTPNFQNNRLASIEEIVDEALRLNSIKDTNAEQLISQARDSKALFILDGLDEKLSHYDKPQQEDFLREIWRLFPSEYLTALNQRNTLSG